MSTNLEGRRLAKVCGLYRWQTGAGFDHDYYRTRHARLAVELLAQHGLLRFECDRVLIDDPQPGAVVAVSNAYFSDLRQAQAALAAAGPALAADLACYTTLRPELQLSEVWRFDP